MAQLGALGYYTETRPGWIWLDVMFTDSHAHTDYLYGTIIHEMVHYLDFEYVQPNNPKFDVCESEAQAWRIENSFFVETGHHEWANWNWREDYEHCQAGLGYNDTDD